MVRVVRWKRRTSSLSSIRAIAFATAERVRCRRSPAAAKPPASTAATNTSTPLNNSATDCRLEGTDRGKEYRLWGAEFNDIGDHLIRNRPRRGWWEMGGNRPDFLELNSAP